MAIVLQINVESRRYSGYVDPRYPIGYWQGALSLVGNATGGLIGLDLVFQQANGGQLLNSQMYSVERVSATHSDGTNRAYTLSALNMGGPANLGFQHSYVVEVRSRSGGVLCSLDGRFLTMIPIFLGSQRSAGTTASLSLVGANVDLLTVRFEAEGYRWSPRSVLVDGGPQRPPTGLYAR